MHIVVLDGYTANPGDLSWKTFRQFGQLTVYDRTSPESLLERAAGAEILLTNKTLLNKEQLESLPLLQYIGLLSTGTNVVDLAFCRQTGIAVTNVPGYSTPSVAQLVFAFLLHFSNQITRHSDSVRQGDWSSSPDFSYWLSPLTEWHGKTIGIVGYGQIGRKVAEIARTFGFRVRIHSRTKPADEAGEWLEWEELLRTADVVSLHCPLTAETANLINRETLSWMKPSAYLINTARGPLVAEQDLADALNQGRLAGAGLDVLVQEPPKADNPLLSAKNCLITPHLAWASLESRRRLLEIAAENIRCFLAGRPQNQVI